MNSQPSFRIGLILLLVCFLAVGISQVEARQARQPETAVQVNANDISGVVASAKGPEAGVITVL